MMAKGKNIVEEVPADRVNGAMPNEEASPASSLEPHEFKTLEGVASGATPSLEEALAAAVAQADLDLTCAVEQAVAPLNREITALQTKVADLTAQLAAKETPKPPVMFTPPAPAPALKDFAGIGRRRARVHLPGTHVGSIDVEIPTDAADPRQAAIEAAKAARGITHFGSAPEVEFVEN